MNEPETGLDLREAETATSMRAGWMARFRAGAPLLAAARLLWMCSSGEDHATVGWGKCVLVSIQRSQERAQFARMEQEDAAMAQRVARPHDAMLFPPEI